MSPEKFHDALNYLDDDLIQQTDDLRQGRRVPQTRPTARQVIFWAAPAACLMLALGLAPRLLPATEADSYAQMPFEGMLDHSNGSPEKAAIDETIYGSTSQSVHGVPADWQRVSNNGIALSIPADWEYELAIADDGSYFIVIRPAEAEGSIQVGYMTNFGVCGTGLNTEEAVIAGMNACVGTYDDNQVWSFITFSDAGEGYVVLNEGADEWWGVYGDTAMEILETIVISEKE